MMRCKVILLVLGFSLSAGYVKNVFSGVTSSRSETVQGIGAPVVSALSIESTGGATNKISAGADTISLNYTFVDPDGDDDQSDIQWYLVNSAGVETELTAARGKKTYGVLDKTLVSTTSGNKIKACITAKTSETNTTPSVGNRLPCVSRDIGNMTATSFSSPLGLLVNPYFITGIGSWTFSYGPIPGTAIHNSCDQRAGQNHEINYFGVLGNGTVRQRYSPACSNTDVSGRYGAVFYHNYDYNNRFVMKSGDSATGADDFPSLILKLDDSTPKKRYLLTLTLKYRQAHSLQRDNKVQVLQGDGTKTKLLFSDDPGNANKEQTIDVDIYSGGYLSVQLTQGTTKDASDHWVEITATGYEVQL